ncbi:hypothetical protein SEA_OPIE_65 [Gordonia phage Opie]|nr:hypothetical protein SEA_OPIE_65 [Gordonia phage Opie]
MPQRIQRRRTKDWRMPEGAVYVGRPSQWGNPINLSDVAAQFPSVDERGVAQMVVRDFAVLARRGQLHVPNWRSLGGERGPVTWFYPTVDLIRAELGGHDLACWCPLDQPCHADVLLALANGSDG